jgi:RimJ/RimL family protein N-acetyltransferase
MGAEYGFDLAGKEDHEGLVNLLLANSGINSNFSEGLTEHFVSLFRETVDSSDCFFGVVRGKERLVGYWHLTEAFFENGVLECAMVYVDSSERGKGHGKRLVLAEIDFARQMNYQRIVTSIKHENTPSRKLHESLGFENVGKVDEGRDKYVLVL